MGSVIELYFIAKLAKLLTQDWTSTDAYKLGIVDKKGKALKKIADLQSSQEKSAYSILHRFAFNMRRIIETFPGGKSKITRYLAVYALLKEEDIPKGTKLNEIFADEFSRDINTTFQRYLLESSGEDEEL